MVVIYITVFDCFTMALISNFKILFIVTKKLSKIKFIFIFYTSAS